MVIRMVTGKVSGATLECQTQDNSLYSICFWNVRGGNYTIFEHFYV